MIIRLHLLWWCAYLPPMTKTFKLIWQNLHSWQCINSIAKYHNHTQQPINGLNSGNKVIVYHNSNSFYIHHRPFTNGWTCFSFSEILIFKYQSCVNCVRCTSFLPGFSVHVNNVQFLVICVCSHSAGTSDNSSYFVEIKMFWFGFEMFVYEKNVLFLFVGKNVKCQEKTLNNPH